MDLDELDDAIQLMADEIEHGCVFLSNDELQIMKQMRDYLTSVEYTRSRQDARIGEQDDIEYGMKCQISNLEERLSHYECIDHESPVDGCDDCVKHQTVVST